MWVQASIFEVGGPVSWGGGRVRFFWANPANSGQLILWLLFGASIFHYVGSIASPTFWLKHDQNVSVFVFDHLYLPVYGSVLGGTCAMCSQCYFQKQNQ